MLLTWQYSGARRPLTLQTLLAITIVLAAVPQEVIAQRETRENVILWQVINGIRFEKYEAGSKLTFIAAQKPVDPRLVVAKTNIRLTANSTKGYTVDTGLVSLYGEVTTTMDANAVVTWTVDLRDVIEIKQNAGQLRIKLRHDLLRIEATEVDFENASYSHAYSGLANVYAWSCDNAAKDALIRSATKDARKAAEFHRYNAVLQAREVIRRHVESEKGKYKEGENLQIVVE